MAHECLEERGLTDKRPRTSATLVAELERTGHGGSQTAQIAREVLYGMLAAQRAREAYRDGLRLMLSRTA